jgi:hypothetical protein
VVEREPAVAALVVGEAADQAGLDRAAPAGELLRGAVAVSELGVARTSRESAGRV